MIKTENLENVYKILTECYNDYLANQNSVLLQYIADSCVKRFEYILETVFDCLLEQNERTENFFKDEDSNTEDFNNIITKRLYG